MSLRFTLKEATEPMHASVERTLGILSVASVEEYVGKLGRFYDFYRANEPSLSAFLESNGQPFYRDRMKQPLLEKDLAFFSAPKGGGAAETIDFASMAEAFGALYVIEGSTLGGQVISRHLRDRFNLSAEGGAAFFSGYGADTGRKWREFCELLEAQASHDIPAAIMGAKRAFAVMEASLARTAAP